MSDMIKIVTYRLLLIILKRSEFFLLYEKTQKKFPEIIYFFTEDNCACVKCAFHSSNTLTGGVTLVNANVIKSRIIEVVLNLTLILKYSAVTTMQ